MLATNRTITLSPLRLAWRHFRRHWLFGQALLFAWICLSALLNIKSRFAGGGLSGALMYSIFYGFFLGIPAAVVGVLRVPLMKKMFMRAQAQPEHWGITRLLGWTLLVFLVPVVVVASMIGISFISDQAEYGMVAVAFYYVFLISIPWLLGALLATFNLHHQLRASLTIPFAKEAE